MNLAILASYNATALDAIQNAIANKVLNDVKVKLLISNNTDARAFKRAQKYNIASKLINATLYQDIDEELFDTLYNNDIDIIFLAGYMKKIPPKVIQNFKIINSHPALLPKFGGKGMFGSNVHKAVVQSKEKISGVTVHQVNENYDDGKIILQKSLVLHQNETAESLELRIKALEKVAIVEALAKCLN